MRSEVLISPSLLSADPLNYHQELLRLEEGGADTLHLDVMDGHFVPNLTFGTHVWKHFAKVGLPLDVHLMVTNPMDYLKDCVEYQVSFMTIHQEAVVHLDRCLAQIRQEGIGAGVALNPSTPVESLEWVLDKIDMVLLMSVNPGFGGQSFLSSTYPKILRLLELYEKYDLTRPRIAIDGGVCLENAAGLIATGADYLVAGSAIFGHSSQDYGTAIRALRG